MTQRVQDGAETLFRQLSKGKDTRVPVENVDMIVKLKVTPCRPESLPTQNITLVTSLRPIL